MCEYVLTPNLAVDNVLIDIGGDDGVNTHDSDLAKT